MAPTRPRVDLGTLPLTRPRPVRWWEAWWIASETKVFTVGDYEIALLPESVPLMGKVSWAAGPRAGVRDAPGSE